MKVVRDDIRGKFAGFSESTTHGNIILLESRIIFLGEGGICDSPWPNKGSHVNRHMKAVSTLDELDWFNLSVSKGSYSLPGCLLLLYHNISFTRESYSSFPSPSHCHQPAPSHLQLSPGWLHQPSNWTLCFHTCPFLPVLHTSSQEWPLKVIHAILPCPSPEKVSVGFHFTLGKTPRLVAMPTRQDPAPGFLGLKALWPSFLWLSHQLLSFMPPSSQFLEHGKICFFLLWVFVLALPSTAPRLAGPFTAFGLFLCMTSSWDFPWTTHLLCYQLERFDLYHTIKYCLVYIGVSSLSVSRT